MSEHNRFRQLIEAIDLVMEDEELSGPDGVCPALFESGDPASGVLLVTGENAGGKSFLARQLSVTASGLSNDDGSGKIESMNLGMALRTAPGLARTFVFAGDESEDSTGTLTLNSVLGGLRNSAKREHRHILILDEPDIGLSQGYADALSERIADYAGNLGPNCCGMIVVTHNSTIAARLLGLSPHALRVGPDRRPTARWIAEGSLPKSIDDLESLHKRSVQTRRRISDLIASRREARRAAPTTTGRKRARRGARHRSEGDMPESHSP